MPEARGSTPRGRTPHGGIAQRREQPSHKRHVVCSTHTPVTDRKEVVVYWPTAVRACGLCDVLDDLSLCFAFEDASSLSSGDARAVLVANATTSPASSAVRSA
jgi:hypothetical protein